MQNSSNQQLIESRFLEEDKESEFVGDEELNFIDIEAPEDRDIVYANMC